MRQMKDSGSEWIGEIPESWEIGKVKNFLISYGSGGTPDSSKEEYYDDNGTPWVVIADMTEREYIFNTAKRVTEKAIWDKRLSILPVGTILYAMYASVGKVSELAVAATINQAIIGLQFDSVKVDKRFMKLFLQSWEPYIKAETNGTTQFNLNANKVVNLSVVHPMLEEQENIVQFIDTKCAKIDILIAHEEATIEELKAYKLSAITEAVTRGIDQSIPLKDSGVEGVGEIPISWSISQIKRISKFNDAVDYSQFDIISYTPMECVGRGVLQLNEIKVRNISSGLTAYKEGDILMAKVTPCFENGNLAVAANLLNGVGVGSSELFTFTPFNVNTRWLFYFLQNSKFKSEAVASMTGTGGLKRVSPKFVRNYLLALPSKDEQQKIADYLDKKCDDIDSLISIKQQKIEELKEYKKSLIYEYITGKKEIA